MQLFVDSGSLKPRFYPPTVRQNPRLKYPPELEEPLAMSAVADASSKNQRPHGGLRQNAHGKVIGELAGAGKPYILPNS